MPNRTYKKFEENPYTWSRVSADGDKMEDDDFEEFKQEFDEIKNLKPFNGELGSELASSLAERTKKHFNDFLTTFNEDIAAEKPMSDQACESLKSFLATGALCYSVSNGQLPELVEAFNGPKERYEKFENALFEIINASGKLESEFKGITENPLILDRYASNPNAAFSSLNTEIGPRLVSGLRNALSDEEIERYKEQDRLNIEQANKDVADQEAADKAEKEKEEREKEEKEKREKEEREKEENREFEEELPEELKAIQEQLKKTEEQIAQRQKAVEVEEEPKELTEEEKKAAVLHYEDLKLKFDARLKKREQEMKEHAVIGEHGDGEEVDAYNKMSDLFEKSTKKQRENLEKLRKSIYGYRSKEDTIKDALENDYADTLKEYPGMETVIRNFEGAKYDYVTAEPGTELDPAKKMLYFGIIKDLYKKNQYSNYDSYDEHFCSSDDLVEEFFVGEGKQKAFKDDMDKILLSAKAAFEQRYPEDRKFIVEEIEAQSLDQNELDFTQKFIDKGDDLVKQAHKILSTSSTGELSGHRGKGILEEAEKLYVKQLTSTDRDECIDLTTEYMLKLRLADRIRENPEASDETIAADYEEVKPILKDYLTNLAGEDKWASNLKNLMDASGINEFYTIPRRLFGKLEGVEYFVTGEEVKNHDKYSEEELNDFKKSNEEWYDDIKNTAPVDEEKAFVEAPKELQEFASPKIEDIYTAFTAVRTERDLDKVYEAAATAIVNTREYFRAIRPDGDTNEERIKYEREKDIDKITKYLQKDYKDNTTELRKQFKTVSTDFKEFCKDIHEKLKLQDFDLSIEAYKDALLKKEQNAVSEEVEQEDLEGAVEEKEEDIVEDTRSEYEKEKSNTIISERKDALDIERGEDHVISSIANAIRAKNELEAYKNNPNSVKFMESFGAANSIFAIKDCLSKSYAGRAEELAKKGVKDSDFGALVNEVNNAVKKNLENKDYARSFNKEYDEFSAANRSKKNITGAETSKQEAIGQGTFRYNAIRKLNKAKDPDAIYQAAAEVLSAELGLKNYQSTSYIGQSRNAVKYNANIIKPYLEQMAPKGITNIAESLKDAVINPTSRKRIAEGIEKQCQNDIINKRKEDLKNILKEVGLDPNDKKSLANIITLNSDGNEKAIEKCHNDEIRTALKKRISAVGQLGANLRIDGASSNNADCKKSIDEYENEKLVSIDELNAQTLNYVDGFINDNRLAIRNPKNPEDVRFIIYGEDGLKLSAPINELRDLPRGKAAELGLKSEKTLKNAIARFDNVVKLQKEFDPKAIIGIIQGKVDELGEETSKNLTSMVNWTAQFIDKHGIVNDAPSKEYVKDIPAKEPEKEEESLVEEVNEEIKTENKVEATNDNIVVENPKGDIKVEAPKTEAKAPKEFDNNAYEKELAMFGKLAKNLEKSKTFVNSKEYGNIITLVNALAKDDRNEGPKARTAKLALAGKAINDYLAHKSKDGVKPNVFKKLAAVESVSKYLDGKLKEHQGESVKISVGKNKSVDINISDIKLGLNDRIAAASPDAQEMFNQHYDPEFADNFAALKSIPNTARIGTFMEYSYDCMNKIMLGAAEKHPNNLADLSKMRAKFTNPDFVKDEIKNHKEEVKEEVKSGEISMI